MSGQRPLADRLAARATNGGRAPMGAALPKVSRSRRAAFSDDPSGSEDSGARANGNDAALQTIAGTSSAPVRARPAALSPADTMAPDSATEKVGSGVVVNGAENGDASTSPENRSPRGSADNKAGPVRRKGARGPKKMTDPFEFIEAVRNGTERPEFCYLAPVGRGTSDHNPYNLQIVPHAATDKTDFYTISASGVTHFVNGVADFTPLDVWEHEWHSFHKVRQIRLFKYYRMWKCYSVWRKNVRRKRVRESQNVVQENLFLCNSTLNGPLQRVRDICAEIADLKLHSVEPEKTYALEDFVAAQRDQRGVLANELSTRFDLIREVVFKACEISLERLETNDQAQHENGGKAAKRGSVDAEMREIMGWLDEGDGDVGSVENQAESDTAWRARKRREAHARRKQRAEKFNVSVLSKDKGDAMRYTHLAARRSECRRLTSFIKLVDYIMADTLHRLTLSSIRDILELLQGSEGAEAEGREVRPPLFRVEAVLQYEKGELDATLRFEPQPAVMYGAIDDIISGFVDTVVSVPKFIFHPDFRPFTTAAHSTDIAAATNAGTALGAASSTGNQGSEQQQMEQNGDGVLDLAQIIDDSDVYRTISQSIKASLAAAFEKVSNYSAVFKPYLDIFVTNRLLDIQSLRESSLNVNYGEKLIVERKDDIEKMEEIPVVAAVDLLEVDSEQLKEDLCPAPQEALEELQVVIPSIANEMNEALLSDVSAFTRQIQTSPSEVESFVEYLQHLDRAIASQDDISNRSEHVRFTYEMIARNDVEVPDEENALYQTLLPSTEGLRSAIESAEERRENEVEQSAKECVKLIKKMRAEILSTNKDAEDPMLSNDLADADEVLERLGKLNDVVESYSQRAQAYARYQRVLRVEVAEYDDLTDLTENLSQKLLLWNSLSDWDVVQAEWIATRVDELDPNQMTDKVNEFSSTVSLLSRSMPNNAAVSKLQKLVDNFSPLLPIVRNLDNKALKSRHWEQIQEAIGGRIVRGKEFTLEKLMDLNAVNFSEEITAISGSATNEALLEEMMKKVEGVLDETEMPVAPHKNNAEDGKSVGEVTYIVTGADDVIAVLEDVQSTVSTIRASRFVAPLINVVERLDKQLSLFAKTFDEWLALQIKWIYLESIFFSADIQRQLPAEYKLFAGVDKLWKDIMRRAFANPNALRLCTADGLLDQLKTANAQLEQVQKSLEDYLDTKRLAFPRFYFLSNDELIQILAQTRNAQAVQPHLKKCFMALTQLEFSSASSNEIIAMMSIEKERVDFVKPPKARGHVENWLTAVEEAMQTSLKKVAKDSVEEHAQLSRADWILSFPSQIILAVAQIYWGHQIETALQAVKQGMQLATTDEEREAARAPLQGVLDLQIQYVEELAEMTQTDLTSLKRGMIAALITIDVHGRDVIAKLVDDQVGSVEDFNWKKQFRYYWDAEKELVVIRQNTASFEYGYEYLGSSARLVLTPLTDRCYMTLTGALEMHLGGAPAGPAGTGKTETVKDLAKALARNCAVINCSDGLDHRMMAQFFSGLAQTGAWGCFDEFNRINIEVLSVIAAQLRQIKDGIDAGGDRFSFEGKTIKLDHGCGYFITMNPGYAGRTELPDNLKVMFRPAAMMIPNYALIAEIVLFGEGFRNAKILAQKMVQLYQLSSQQLSKQDHYDFGMRAVKSVLVMAGALKRSSPDVDEDLVLIRALRDSNVPKFLREDIPLFQGLLQDLFPGVVLPDSDQKHLIAQIKQSLIALGLQVVPALETKILQLYDTLNVRHGIMLVGPTSGGKSTCYKVLQHALGQLHKDYPEEGWLPVKIDLLNPKCVSLGVLYGEFNLITREWSDGIVSTLVRDCVDDKSQRTRWIIFDGPVDALWIENMNSVLDDNKLLCLDNGERIQLTPNTRMFFEVADLAVASPATVSRCGMVYLDEFVLGWRPYFMSWLASYVPELCGAKEQEKTEEPVLQAPAEEEGAEEGEKPAAAEEEEEDVVVIKSIEDYPYAVRQVYAYLLELGDRYLDDGLKMIRRDCKESMPSVDANLVQSFCHLFSALFTHPKHKLNVAKILQETDVQESEENPPMHEEVRRMLNMAFLFSFTWSIGGNVDEDSRQTVDGWVRQAFEGVVAVPGQNTVYSYFIDPNDVRFRSWASTVDTFNFDPSKRFFQMIVPTADMACYGYLLALLTYTGRHVLLCGPTGVGKTVTIANQLDPAASESNSQDEERLEDKFLPLNVSFTAQTSAIRVQQTLEDNMVARRTHLAPPVGKKMILFVDDVNMPQLEEYFAQPPVEFLRQLMDSQGFYDREKIVWKTVEGASLITACGPPGGGRNHMTPRFVRHFNLLYMPPPDQEVVTSIFGAITNGFLKAVNFPTELHAVGNNVVAATLELYSKVKAAFLPTPAKSHYLFNQRDVGKVFEGFLKARPNVLKSKQALATLWAHESMRAFHDRLVDVSDRTVMKEIVLAMLQSHFGVRVTTEELFDGVRSDLGGAKPVPLLFGDLLDTSAGKAASKSALSASMIDLNAGPRYEHMLGHKKIQDTLYNHLVRYNASLPAGAKEDLVFFKDAVDHINRIIRIVRNPRGHALLIGVSGSGKRSLTRLAAHIASYRCFEIAPSKQYGPDEFKEDLKVLFTYAGVEGKDVVFLVADSQLTDESFLEDINGILNTGEVPNLFEQDEYEKVITDMSAIAKEQDLSDRREDLYKLFISRVQEHLHIVLSMSPISESFRARTRMFPSLVNCCSIDWFDEWPATALKEVSESKVGLLEEGLVSQMPVSRQEDPEALVEISEKIVTLCTLAQTSSVSESEAMFEEGRRRTYITPAHFLQLFRTLGAILDRHLRAFDAQHSKLSGGLSQLRKTNESVAVMQETLTALQPQLDEKDKATEALLAKLRVDQTEADAYKEVVTAEEQQVSVRTVEIETLAEDAKSDLAEALPVLQAAVEALQHLNRNDIVEVRTFKQPSDGVKLTMEAVCVLLQQPKPAEWDTAKKVLGDPRFLQTLQTFDKENIPQAVIDKIQKFVADPNFVPEIVERSSVACKSMCVWVRAIESFNKVYKVVEPKKKLVAEMTALLDQSRAELAEKQQALADVEAKLRSLKEEFERSIEEKRSLQEQKEDTTKKLGRAEKITVGLADEQTRWAEQLEELEAEKPYILGNSFLAAASMVYLGPFTRDYRQRLIEKWRTECEALDVPFKEGYELSSDVELAPPVLVQDWQIYGLPTDALSTTNGCLVWSNTSSLAEENMPKAKQSAARNATKWPMMIDPVGQANRWIRKMEAPNGLKVLKQTDNSFLRALENCIRLGTPVLIEDCEEELDPSIEPLLRRAVTEEAGRQIMRLGGNDVDYDPLFRLYLTTKLSNPHFQPETCINVCVINFTVTLKGLEDQLLGEVVSKERPDVEERRAELISSLASDKKQLKEIEDKILRIIYSAEGNILSDETLINTLTESKVTSGAISERVKEAQVTEVQIAELREGFRPIATRGSIIYFGIADLALLDPMYQFSLGYFTVIYNNVIVSTQDESQKGKELAPDVFAERLAMLVQEITYASFANVSRGLFKKHTLVFSFLLSGRIALHEGSISETEWMTFLRGAATLMAGKERPKPDSISHLSENSWNYICAMEDSMNSVFDGLVEQVSEGAVEDWLEFVMRESAEGVPDGPGDPLLRLPRSWTDGKGKTLTAFQHALVVASLKPEFASRAMTQFVSDQIGERFTEKPASILTEVFKDTTVSTPVMFILSQGSDPSDDMAKLVAEKGFQEKYNIVSLGRGQGPLAETHIEKARKNGSWVFLQNLHVATSFMGRLEAICADLAESKDEVHPDFRLFLSSMPSKIVPVAILQNSVKLTNEPPAGLRANMLRGLTTVNTEEFNEPAPEFALWRNLVFAVTFFHANIQERKKFGPLGWNVLYEWTDSDLEVALRLLRQVCTPEDGASEKTAEEIQWDALCFLTGDIFYGGRVTDDWDRRCLHAILRYFYSPKMAEESAQLSESGRYLLPPPSSKVDDLVRHIRAFPAVEEPEVFGLSVNASRTLEMTTFATMLDELDAVQPKDSGSSNNNAGDGEEDDEVVVETDDDKVEAFIEVQLAALPAPLSMDDACTSVAKTFVNHGAKPEKSDSAESLVSAVSKSASAAATGDGGGAGTLELGSSMTTVLSQEIDRYNKLLKIVKKALIDLRLAVKGLVVMSEQLENVYEAILADRLPKMWAAVGYPTLRPLRNWLLDLQKRVAFFESWLTKGQPAVFWCGAFYFPQALLTALLQAQARKYGQSIDTLAFRYEVCDTPAEDIKEAAEDGEYISGLFLEGAHWDEEKKSLVPSPKGEMLQEFPVVHFIPAQDYTPEPELYSAPLYRTRVRAGVLSTTGHSTNFVAAVHLPTIAPPDTWTLSATALFQEEI